MISASAVAAQESDRYRRRRFVPWNVADDEGKLVLIGPGGDLEFKAEDGDALDVALSGAPFTAADLPVRGSGRADPDALGRRLSGADLTRLAAPRPAMARTASTSGEIAGLAGEPLALLRNRRARTISPTRSPSATLPAPIARAAHAGGGPRAAALGRLGLGAERFAIGAAPARPQALETGSAAGDAAGGGLGRRHGGHSEQPGSAEAKRSRCASSMHRSAHRQVTACGLARFRQRVGSGGGT